MSMVFIENLVLLNRGALYQVPYIWTSLYVIRIERMCICMCYNKSIQEISSVFDKYLYIFIFGFEILQSQLICLAFKSPMILTFILRFNSYSSKMLVFEAFYTSCRESANIFSMVISLIVFILRHNGFGFTIFHTDNTV
jgi:hypothetical protein